MKPLISIITITYNASMELPATLDSIRCQKFRNFEHILMDGCSNDATLDIARKAGIKEIRIFSSPDHGIYDAMNKGLAEARGLYVLFLNAGDALHSPDTLALVAKAIEDNDMPGVVYGQTDIVDSDRRFIAPRHLTAPDVLTLDSFKNGMMVCHQAFYALRKIVPGFNTKYRFSADYEWCIRCLQHSRHNVYIPEVLADYLNEGATTRNRFRSLRERFSIMCYYYGVIPTIGRHIHFLFRYLSTKNKPK